MRALRVVLQGHLQTRIIFWRKSEFDLPVWKRISINFLLIRTLYQLHRLWNCVLTWDFIFSNDNMRTFILSGTWIPITGSIWKRCHLAWKGSSSKQRSVSTVRHMFPPPLIVTNECRMLYETHGCHILRIRKQVNFVVFLILLALTVDVR